MNFMVTNQGIGAGAGQNWTGSTTLPGIKLKPLQLGPVNISRLSVDVYEIQDKDFRLTVRLSSAPYFGKNKTFLYLNCCKG